MFRLILICIAFVTLVPTLLGGFATLSMNKLEAANNQDSPEKTQSAPASADYDDGGWGDSSGSTYTIRKSNDGHFRTEGLADGAYIDFLVDTGATTIALTASDARKAGYTDHNLEYNYTVNTANGTTKAAMITLDRVTIGAITVRDVRAAVIQDGLSTSLLGMSFLGKLQNVDVNPHTMTIRL